MRRLPLTLLSALVALCAVSAPAAAAPPADAEAAAIARARANQGRWCPITGCATQSASLASVGGFAAATLGALALARRRSS